MRTERQIEASRRNGAKSRGPVTAAGKLNSSRNSLKHGLTAAKFLLTAEDPAIMAGLYRNLANDLHPETDLEHELLHTIAFARCCLMRIRTREKALRDRAMPEASLSDEVRLFSYIDRNEDRYTRICQSAMREFRALKAGARQAQNSPQSARVARKMLIEQNEPGIPLKTKGRA